MNLRTMRKLPSASKVWKVFTNTLQSKLHKLNRSKAIKKPPQKGRFNRTGKRVSWPTFSIQSRRRKQKFHFNTAQKLRCHHLQEKPSPVYIDQLFLEPPSVANEHVEPSVKEIAAREEYKEELSLPCRNERVFVDPQDHSMPGTSNQDWDANETMHTADDMWESLVLASPQMHGINERAEEFIARFRAEMRHQEKLARQ